MYLWPLALLSSAHAYVFIGNPTLHVQIDRSEGDLTWGTAKLDRVRVFKCGGGYTDHPIDAWIDPIDGWSAIIEGGNLCGIGLRWDTDVSIGSSAFTLRYEQLTTSVSLDASGAGSASFSPFIVDSGSFSGSTPTIEIWLD